MIDAHRLAAEFARMAEISSPSRQEGAMARYLAKRFAALGAEVLFDDAGRRVGGETGNLIARFPGRGEPLIISVLMDTVEPFAGVVPLLRDGICSSAGETILGADDKAGIAELIEALEVLAAEAGPRPPLEVVVTICEEIGLVGAKHLDYSLLRARRALALDTSGVDLVIHRAPGANKLRFDISGREAHAGIAPQQGLSAIEVAARAIAAMRLGRIDAETTANIGTISGGQATNIVARSVVVEGEARSHDLDKLAAQTAHMVECFEQAAAASARQIDGSEVRAGINAEILSEYPLLNVPVTAPIVTLLQRAAGHLGRTLEIRAAGGGSDANIFAGHGIETVIVGTGMRDVHTVKESVSVADMVRVTELLVATIRLAAENEGTG